MTGAEIVAAGRQYLGTRWVHQGRSRSGVDCVGLLVLVARDLGIPHQDVRNYDRRPAEGQLERILGEQLVAIPRHEVRIGDVVALEDRQSRQVCHVGILTDGARPFALLHAWIRMPERIQKRGVVEMRLSEDWKKRIRTAYSWPGLEP